MNKKQIEDKIMGDLNEEYIIEVIKENFNIKELIKTSSNHPMDFKYNNTYFEIKSRRNYYNTYPTTMIGKNKIDWLKTNKINDAYFIFVFEDGDYYYKYDVNDNLFIGTGGRKDRGKAEFKKYCYIPITKLIKMI